MNYFAFQLWVQINSNWYLHGSFTDMDAMVHAVKELCNNPDVRDFRVTPG